MSVENNTENDHILRGDFIRRLCESGIELGDSALNMIIEIANQIPAIGTERAVGEWIERKKEVQLANNLTREDWEYACPFCGYTIWSMYRYTPGKESDERHCRYCCDCGKRLAIPRTFD